MKALVFDLDDTLIDWKNEYISIIYNYMIKNNHNISLELCYEISKLVDINEKRVNKLSKEGLLYFINKELKIDLDLKYMDDFIKSFKNCSYKDNDILNTIDYLSKKYDLYVVTNWFTEAQMLRLDTMGILKYFKKVYGADIGYLKPDKRAFDEVLKMYKASDIISIGDNLENDIIVPKELGMNVIWKTSMESSDYTTIKHIKELINIL